MRQGNRFRRKRQFVAGLLNSSSHADTNDAERSKVPNETVTPINIKLYTKSI